MNQGTLENKDPSHRVGVKYLDERQIENTFPDYPALLERIEDQRRIASYANRLLRQDLEQRQPQMYDNVYAVLGGRGTGKSSVLLTLQEHLLKTPNQRDIVFPIITPEVIIGNNCSIIGWIMSMTEQMIDKIEGRIKQVADSDFRLVNEKLDAKMNFFKDCHFNRRNKLREHYQNLMRDCNQDNIPLSAYSFDETVGLRVHLSHKHYTLIQELNKFWYEMTDSWRALNEAESSYRRDGGNDISIPHPLIILLFDDIDLVPERSMELLSTTFQYFTNSNIVLILTAAEKMLKRVIWMKMLERLTGSNYNSLLVDFFQKQTLQEPAESEEGKSGRTEGFSLAFVDRMEMEYYDKVIPPSSRFYLRRFRTISERRRFRYASTGQSFETPKGNMSKPLGDFLIHQIDDLIAILKTSTPHHDFRDGLTRKNFLVNGNGELRETYLLMFGDKNRSISNGCLGILNCISRLKRIAGGKRSKIFPEADHSRITNALRYLLQTLMLSKSEVAEFHDSVDSFIYQRGAQRDIYTDYQCVWKKYIQKRESIRRQIQGERSNLQEQFSNEPAFNIANYLRDKEENALGELQRQIAILFVMLVFAENLLIILEPRHYCNDTSGQRKLTGRTPGGGRELTSLLNADVFGMQGPTAETSLFGQFKPFSVRQSSEDLLDRSPLLLEHIKKYVGFKPFDLSHVQIYLMDTFYAPVTTGRWRSSERLEAFLEKSLQHEEDWVRSVLKMLFIRYSGIAFIEKDFINFCAESRRRLEQIDIGGWLNEKIQETFAEYIKNGSLLKSNPVQIRREIMALGTAPQIDDEDGAQEKDLKTILETFFASSGLSISDLNSQFEWGWDRKSTENLLDIFTCEAWPSWPRKQNAGDPFVMIVDFVERRIKMVAQFLVQECHIKLSREKLGKVLDTLSEIPDTSIQIRKKRIETEGELRKLANVQAEAGNIEDTDENIRIPMKILSDYLYELQNFLFYGDNAGEADDSTFYFRYQMVQNYFYLLNFVIPYAPEADMLLAPPPDLRSLEQEETSDVTMIPCNFWFVLELRMIAKLLPTYFAAKFELNYGNVLLDGGSPLTESGNYPQEQAVDKVLKDLYDSLTKQDSNKRLHRIMQEVSTELTDQYISQLGGV